MQLWSKNWSCFNENFRIEITNEIDAKRDREDYKYEENDDKFSNQQY